MLTQFTEAHKVYWDSPKLLLLLLSHLNVLEKSKTCNHWLSNVVWEFLQRNPTGKCSGLPFESADLHMLCLAEGDIAVF